MLFLFRSAPEVEKRIHSKFFRKFWRSRGTKEPAYITVEHTVNECGRAARGSCLSSAYVWTSSKAFLNSTSSEGKFASQNEWFTTYVHLPPFAPEVQVSSVLALEVVSKARPKSFKNLFILFYDREKCPSILLLWCYPVETKVILVETL